MAKIKLTEELAKTIRNTRIANNIKTIELAKEIDKSTAYISKLEAGGFKNIDFHMLLDIFKFIIGDKEDFNDFVEKTLEKCHIEFTDEELEKQKWMLKFDTEVRQIPISQELVGFISDKLKHLNISAESVIREINKNTELKECNIKIKDEYEFNTYIEDEGKTFIVYNLEDDLLAKILARNIKSVNYITMKGIIRILLKLQGVSDNEDKAVEILNSFKFYTLAERNKLLSKNEHDKAINEILNDYDRDNIKYVNSIFGNIKILSNWNIDYTNERLENLAKSFDTDAPFILSVIGRNYFDLKDLKVEDKKKFLTELKELINKFAKITYDEKDNFNEY